MRGAVSKDWAEWPTDFGPSQHYLLALLRAKAISALTFTLPGASVLRWAGVLRLLDARAQTPAHRHPPHHYTHSPAQPFYRN